MQNRIVVVSGATSGIGLAAVRVLAAAGATVVGCGRTQAKVEKLSPELAKAGQVTLQTVDVRDNAAVTDFVATVRAKHGRIAGLVQVAGLLVIE